MLSRLADRSLVIGLFFARFVRQPGGDVRQLLGQERRCRRARARASSMWRMTSFTLIPCAIRATCQPRSASRALIRMRSEEHTSELQSRFDLVCRLLLETK